MKRSKKFVFLALLVTVVLAGSIGGGIALAQEEDEVDSQPAAWCGALQDRVCEIYEENTGTAIDPQELQDAFAQARSEMRQEAMGNRLQWMVEEGVITQEEADQYQEWCQSRPDVPLQKQFGHGGFQGVRGGFRGCGGLRALTNS